MADDNGGVPWKVWAIVTILVAVIGGYATLFQHDSSPITSGKILPDFSDKIGVYAGKSLNKMGYAVGNTVLDVQFIDPKSGKVRAYVKWSNGLYGEGSLFGSISDDGLLDLAGTLSSSVTGDFDCELEGKFVESAMIKGTYRCLPKLGNPNGTQDGQFIVTKAIG